MEAKVRYVIGYPGWDKPSNVKVVINEGVVRIIDASYPPKDIYINAKDILDISFDAKFKRSGARAATGALIGGVLTGGIGLLAGAAIGAKAKDKSEMVILFNEDGREREVLLQTKEHTNAVFNAIKDAIAYSKEHEGEDLVKLQQESGKIKTENERLGDEPSTLAGCVFCIVVVCILVLIFSIL